MLPDSKYVTLLAIALMTSGLTSARGVAQPAGQSAPPNQTAAPGAVTRLLGTVTATSANSLTLKLESGAEALVSITPQTRVVRTAPGATTLAGATMIHVQDLETGDRVSVRLAPGSDPTHYAATAVIAMKQADIAQVHASQAEDWQKRGVGGVVKSVDLAAAGAAPAPGTPAPTATITVTNSGHPLQVAVTPTTIIRRYAPDSVNFADAKPATLSDIHPGDQLRARGDHSEDGAMVTAVEIVAGSFRNIAGTIISVDTAQNTVTLNDLATKKPVTLKLTAETLMRKLPPEMAQRLAARGGGRGAGGSAGGGGQQGGSGGGDRPGGGSGATGGAETAGETRPRSDPAAMLQRAPAVTLAELKKGDALMIVASRSTGGSSDSGTAITLIAGVEPLLQGSAGASDSLFSASWNMGGGGAEGAAQ